MGRIAERAELLPTVQNGRKKTGVNIRKELGNYNMSGAMSTERIAYETVSREKFIHGDGLL